MRKYLTLVFMFFLNLSQQALAEEKTLYLALGGAGLIPVDELSVSSANKGYYNSSRKSLLAQRIAFGGAASTDTRWEIEFVNYSKYKVFWEYNNNPKVNAESKLQSQSYLLNFYYDFKNLANAATLYIGAGIGSGYNKVQNVYLSNGQSIRLKANYDLAWNIGGGAIHHLNHDFYIDANYRYLYSGKFKANSAVGDANIPILRGKVSNHMFLLSFGIKI